MVILVWAIFHGTAMQPGLNTKIADKMMLITALNSMNQHVLEVYFEQQFWGRGWNGNSIEEERKGREHSCYKRFMPADRNRLGWSDNRWHTHKRDLWVITWFPQNWSFGEICPIFRHPNMAEYKHVKHPTVGLHLACTQKLSTGHYRCRSKSSPCQWWELCRPRFGMDRWSVISAPWFHGFAQQNGRGWNGYILYILINQVH